jgi:hypothetical protein
MTTSDAIIEEIRESRKRMSEECDHDPAKLIAYLKQYEKKCQSQIKVYRDKHLSSVKKDNNPG